MNRWTLFGSIASIFGNAVICVASIHAADPSPDDFDQLMRASVTSAARVTQPLGDVAAAVYVITNDEIRRSGVTNLPDALRLAPGVEVARVNASNFAISIRGFNSTHAHKTLVMIDGRSIYTPLYAGVFWDAHLPVLEDIDRIEIVRGPGAHIWGANAVSGIINIITLPANLTQQSLFIVGGGEEETLYLRGRSAGRLGPGFLRNSFSYRERDHSGTEAAAGPVLDDRHKTLQLGSRYDWLSVRSLDVSFKTDIVLMEKDFQGAQSQVIIEELGAIRSETRHRGFSASTQVEQNFDGNIYTFRSGYRVLDRQDIFYGLVHTSFDLEYQYDIYSLTGHRLSFGLQYRHNRDRVDGSAVFSLTDEDIRSESLSGFAQDIWALGGGVDLIAGLRFEKHSEVSSALMPSLKALWQHNAFSVWVSASKAVRTPSLLDQYGEAALDGNPRTESALRNALELPDLPFIFMATGNLNYRSEQLSAWEAGMRFYPRHDVLLDLSWFRYDFDRLRTYEFAGFETQANVTFVNLVAANQARGTTQGGELSIELAPFAIWRIAGHLSYWDIDVAPLQGSPGLGASIYELLSPDWQAMLKSYLDITPQWQLNVAVRYLSSRPNSPLETYTAWDLKLAYDWSPELNLAVIGRDLGNSPRYEHQDQVFGPPYTAVRSSLFVQLEWRH